MRQGDGLRGRVRGLECERSVWALVVVVVDVGAHDPLELAAVDGQEPVEAFASDGADPSFGEGVGVGRPEALRSALGEPL